MKKKWKFGLKVADSHSEPGNLQKLVEIFIFFIFFIFFSFFFIFLSFSFPVALKSRKTMKNNGKHQKTKENEKKMKLQMKKKMKIWTQSCRFSLRTRKSSKTRGNFHFFIFFIFFFIFFSFSFPVAPEIQESHEKQWKTMENIKNKGKWKNEVANEKKNENLDSQLHFFFIFLCFLMFSIVFHGFPGFQCHGKGKWKENEKKWKKNEKNEKNENFHEFLKISWFGVRICNFESKFSFFFHLKLQILTPNQEIFKNSRKFSFFYHFFIIFFIFLARGTWNPGKPWKTMKNHQKTKEMKKKWSCKWKKMKLQMKKKWSCKWKKMKFDGKRWWTKMKKNEDKMEKKR